MRSDNLAKLVNQNIITCRQHYASRKRSQSLPDHFLFLAQKTPRHSPQASCGDLLVLRWFPCPPKSKRMRAEQTRTLNFSSKDALVVVVVVFFFIFSPLSLGTVGPPACQSARGMASTAGSHRAVSQQWRRCSQRGWRDWGLGTALWPGQTPGPPTGPRNSWFDGSGGSERIKIICVSHLFLNSANFQKWTRLWVGICRSNLQPVNQSTGDITLTPLEIGRAIPTLWGKISFLYG